MGRPPIKTDTRMKQVTLWLDPEDMARVRAHVGEQSGSDYVRTAIAEKLDRDGAPPFDPVTMPLKQTAPPKRAPKPAPAP